MDAAAAARSRFPRGLEQPEDGYRFSLDPLLLAAFVRPKPGSRLLDLGAGCGVAGLAALLRSPDQDISALGLDIDPAQVQAAQANAARLGLDQAYQARAGDLRLARAVLAPERFHLVLANPPYRAQGSGRTCPDAGRENARAENTAGLGDFLRAAAFALANRGRLAMVFPAARLHELLAGCLAERLAPKRLRLVHPRLDHKARLVLVEAVKNGGSELLAEPPLILHQDRGRLTAQALAFCPWLNAGRTDDASPA